MLPLFTVYKKNIQNIVMNLSNQEASRQFGSMIIFSINEHEPKLLEKRISTYVMKRIQKDNLVHIIQDSEQSKGIKDEKFLSNM